MPLLLPNPLSKWSRSKRAVLSCSVIVVVVVALFAEDEEDKVVVEAVGALFLNMAMGGW